MHRLIGGAIPLVATLAVAPAQAAVFQISVSGIGDYSINGGPRSAIGPIQLIGYGDSSKAADQLQQPSLSSYDVVTPLELLLFRGPGVEAEGLPGSLTNSQSGGPSTQFASLDGTQMHWPIGIPARWPLDLTSFSGGAFAYQPVAPFVSTSGDVISYRYTSDFLDLSGGPSSLPISAPIPEPATILLFAAGAAALRRRTAGQS